MGIDTLAVAGSALDSLVSALLRGASKEAKRLIESWDLARGVSRLARIKFVKPIWNPGTETDLHDFYFPCPISVGDRQRRVTDLSDLPGDHVVIVGRVGQGKSILLRFLGSNELNSRVAGDTSACIPLLLELRHKGGVDVREFAIRRLCDIGLSCDDALFSRLADEGGIALLLDGFDELPSANRENLIDDLERLVARHSRMKVVMTSRPGVNGVEHLAGFDLVTLVDLDATTFEGVVRKQYDPEDQELASSLLKAIEKHEVKELATTPLMAALLVIHFNTYQKIPEKFDSFHEDLFDALLRRHDATKPGFVRARRSKLDDSAMRNWFDRCAYNCMRSGSASWRRSTMLQIAENSLPKRGRAAGSDAILDDAVQVTGLLLEEGGEYEFIHKSVMEYHAASCVKSLSEPTARKIYRSLCSARLWTPWEEVLRFLSVIDRVRYLRHFEIAQLREFLEAPSLQLLFSSDAAFYSLEDGTIFVRRTWLLQAGDRHVHSLFKALGAYVEGSVSADGPSRRIRIPADVLFDAEDDPQIAAAFARFVSWCGSKRSALAAEVAELDDDDLLDLEESALP